MDLKEAGWDTRRDLLKRVGAVAAIGVWAESRRGLRLRPPLRNREEAAVSLARWL